MQNRLLLSEACLKAKPQLFLFCEVSISVDDRLSLICSHLKATGTFIHLSTFSVHDKSDTSMLVSVQKGNV